MRLNEIKEFVCQQRDFHIAAFENPDHNDKRRNSHAHIADKLCDILSFIDNQKTSNECGSEYDDLPEELLDQLSFRCNKSKKKSITQHVIEIMKEVEAPILLDHIMIQIYKRTGEIIKRKPMLGIMHKLRTAGVVKNKQNKKGVYCLL